MPATLCPCPALMLSPISEGYGPVRNSIPSPATAGRERESTSYHRYLTRLLASQRLSPSSIIAPDSGGSGNLSPPRSDCRAAVPDRCSFRKTRSRRLRDAPPCLCVPIMASRPRPSRLETRSEEHTSELPVTNAQLVCRLLLEKKKHTNITKTTKSDT